VFALLGAVVDDCKGAFVRGVLSFIADERSGSCDRSLLKKETYT
jgi:hypothetical protein